MTWEASRPNVDARRALLAGPLPPLLLDASFELSDAAAGEAAHGSGHLPGSLYVHLDRDLCAARTGRNGRHPLPDRAAFARTAASLGVTPGRQVVALDRNGGMYAARLWWMLKWLGHAEVAVLDGGYKAWVAAGGVPSTEPVERTAAAPPYPERPPLVASVDAAGLGHRLGQAMVLDARSGERFRGEKEPIDPVAGHIPGAFNRFHAENLLPGGLFKPAAALREELQAVLGGRSPGDVVHSCGSGVTACHNLLAMEHAGLAGSQLYPGSWSEWSADPARPIARG
jgi:thiosulfate/3-mercaptopyruvate sulfurtransferase